MILEQKNTATNIDVELLRGVRRSSLEQAVRIARPMEQLPSVELLSKAVAMLEHSPPDWDAQGDALLNEMDRLLTDSIDESISSVLHHETIAGFRRRWSSVESLFALPNLPGDFQLNVIQATSTGLIAQLRGAGGDLQKTSIYEHLALATFGGTPFLAVEFDAVLGGGKIDMEMMKLAARLGEAGLFMSLLNVGPGFFGVDDYRDIPKDGKSIRQMFQTQEMSEYSEFRKESYSRFVAACLPAAYTVTPFSREANPAEGIDFTEKVQSEVDLVATGAAAALLERIAESMGLYGWPAAIVGEDWGGKVAGLTVRKFCTATGEELRNATTQMVIHETVEMPFFENGITALISKLESTLACFFAGATASRVIKGIDPKMSKESAMSASLPNMLVTIRFGHYLKALHRKLLGSSKTPKEIETDLQIWANEFVLDQEAATDEAKAERPFRNIKVSVKADEDQPGYLSVELTLTPHFRVSAVQGQLTIAADSTDSKKQ
jgi:type VI secretion system protein ImpC